MKRYGDVLKELIKQNDNFFILTAENMGPIYYIMEEVKNNYLDVGISEQTMMGIATGLALRGRVPVAHAMSSFLLMRPFEFIRTDIGYGKLNVKLVGTSAGFLSERNGMTHQCIEDISLMRNIPNMNIYAPSDNDDMIKMEEVIFKDKKSCYLRYNDMTANYCHEPFEIGKAEKIGEGTDIVLITCGMMFKETLDLKEKLEQNGKKVTLINLRTIMPIDETTILESIKKCKETVIIEDHIRYGGVYNIICEILVKNKVIANIKHIALNKSFKPAGLNEILTNEGFSSEKMLECILKKENG